MKDGSNWYVYCRNNPLKYYDPNGLDAIVFGEGEGYDFATFAFQHQGIAVGNSEIGYFFFETRPPGTAGNMLQEGLILGLAGPIADIYGRSFETIADLADFIWANTKFDKCITIETNLEADLAMVAAALDSPNWYGVFTGIHNCSHLVRGILQQGDVALPSSDMDTAFQLFWLSEIHNIDIVAVAEWASHYGEGGLGWLPPSPSESPEAGWYNGMGGYEN